MDVSKLTISRLFDADRQKVFEAWTDPALIAQWWGPRGVTVPECTWQAQAGGEIKLVMLAGPELGPLAGQEWPMDGRFVEIVAPEKLVFTGRAIMDGKPVLENRCTVILEEQGQQTKMTLTVEVTRITPEGEGPLQGMEAGFQQQTDKLGELLVKISA